MSSINPNEEPFAWACQQVEEELGDSGVRTPGSIAWGIVKARLEAYGEMLGVLDQSFCLLAGALDTTKECAPPILSFRTQVARYQHEADRALEALEGAQAG